MSGYTVLKGSKISSEITYSEKFRGAKSIEKAREGVVDGTLLIKDVTFKSASTAANFVTGTSTNGLKVWKDKKGTTLKELPNSTRFNAIKDANATNTKKGKTSNSFEFTSYWSDASNKIIADLVDFTKTFFAKHSILNILTKYCIFTSENMLMVMRPYQITATERILNRIEIAHNYKKYGDIAAGGYIWHTTGSGKTLTSFKTARLASDLPYIDKVLFVVDRKDLDYQTMKEYDRFEKGAANSNSSTKILEKQLRDSKSKIIITTIQKMSSFIKKFRQVYG